ncbi:MAG: translation elongation factor Ts [Oscillospiraceae bacterium]|jgi:elongation factor Ts|nr:translation elongation factor Ts [Oscillospiraceae bacterium]
MAVFTAKDVQALRETTGVGMMDCKKALTETEGDMEKAVAYLRERGLAAVAKKAGRIAAEGAVGAVVSDTGAAAIVEINSETDFAANSEAFQAFVAGVAGVVVTRKPADLPALMAARYDDGSTVEEALREKVMTIGENIQIRRFDLFEQPLNLAYIHMGGKIGVLVNLKVSDALKDNPKVAELGRDIAMQTAAMRPLWLDTASVDPAVLESEKEIFLAQALGEGKPQAVAEKMVAGRINKYYQEFCLLSQPYVKENKLTVGQHVAQVAKELGGEIEVTRFVRYEKGEGIEKKQDNFADEVAGMVK